MKNLLRKFHIGNNRDDQSSETSAPFAGISEWFSSVTRVNQSSASINQASNGLENSGGTAERTNGGDLAARAEVSPSAKPDYHSLEEEYQVQLAMALSVSNNDIVDPETAEIEAVKRISLGLYPNPNASTSQAEVVAYRYWAYNVLNYDDKVVDGFYDIYGVICDPGAPEKMPLLIDLQGAPVSDSVSCEVVLVNRATDPALAKLEQTAMGLVASCGASKTRILRSTLAQKIAELVAEHMGGSVRSDVEMLKAWRRTSAELRESSQNNVLPLGYLRVGLARHRALLFKVLADCVGIPCRLVKGRHYTGVDEGAVNIIKDVDDREYIIDLMGAPGALIPPDVPGGNPLEHVATKMAISASPAEIEQVKAGVPEVNLGGRHHSEPCELTDALAGSERRFHVRSPSWTEGVGSPAVRQMKVKDMSHFMIDAARDNPGLAQKLHDVLLESGVVAPPDLFSEISPKQLQSQHAQVEEMRRSDRNRNNRVTRSKDKGKPPLGAPKGSSYCHDYSTKERLQRLNSVEGLGERRPLEQSLHAVGGSPIVSAAAAASVLNAVQENFPPELIKHVPVAASAITAAVVASSMVVAAAKAESNDPSLEVPITAATATATAAVVAATSAAAVLRSETGSGGSGKGVSGNRKTSCNEEGNRRKGSSSSDVEPEEKTSGKSDKSSGRADSVMEDAAEWEIPWEELVIGDRIGLGSYGEVYRGDWHGTEVAIKKFLDQDISGDALDEFITEVRLMTRMRHPNVVLFMGAVTRPPNLSIVTEFLPRGSLYKLIHRSNHQLDERRRLRMALDVAKGMNYLHSSTPIIVHRDLKSPNLLVDKNWVVKVCDFGLSRMKHHTFLSSKSQAGTPEWMAPEVLRNEPSNEKADVYSFGVILWELATLQEPWHGMNPMQVVGAVGFQHRRLEIPPDMDPEISKIILECWHNDSNFRPSFAQLMTRLRPFLRPVITSQDPVKQRSRQHQPHQQQQQPQAVSRQEVAAAVTSAADDEQSKI